MQPWNRFTVTEEQLQVMYREWGVFYTGKQKLDIAMNCYDKSLALQADPKALYNRSRCKRDIAKTNEALQDARAAMATDPFCQPYNLEVSDALYQLNELERSKFESSVNSRKFTGIKLDAFEHRSDVLNENFIATMGRHLGPFILKNGKYIHLAFEKIQLEKNVDRRPLWKILREQEKCDVLSVLEVEEELISPREVARRKRAFSIFNQIYMRRSWIDVLFLRALRKNPNLLLPQSQWARPQLEYITRTKYKATMQFLKMLHTRCPMYTEKLRKCPNEELSRKNTEDYLYRVQYQIHRNMLTILKRIKRLKASRRVEELTRYVEEVMGDYVVLKTTRVMPWKFQFINEVYSLLALTHIERFTSIPKNLTDYPHSERLNVLLRTCKQKDNETVPFVFGDRSTYQDPDVDDLGTIHHKAFTGRMEKRLIFAKYPIERAYILHEISRSHLNHARFDECSSVARRCLNEAKKVNCFSWMYLALLIICQSHTFLGKIEKINTTLDEAKEISKKLNDSKVEMYTDFLKITNEVHYQEKKQAEMLRHKGSRASLHKSSSEYDAEID